MTEPLEPKRLDYSQVSQTEHWEWSIAGHTRWVDGKWKPVFGGEGQAKNYIDGWNAALEAMRG